MSYITDSMSEGEQLVETFKLHWVEWIPVALSYLTAIAILGIWWSAPPEYKSEPIVYQAAALFSFAAIMFGTWRHVMLSTLEFGLTDRRVVYKAGFIRRDTREMPLQSIEAVVIHQTIIARILGFGNVRVTGKTAGVSDVALRNLRKPLDCKRMIENQRYGAPVSPHSVPTPA